ncbi:site-specific integrase [Streptomyces avermitilis]
MPGEQQSVRALKSFVLPAIGGRRPWRPLTYDAARMMFNRANEVLGSNRTLHDPRHTATCLMSDDPTMPPVYVRHILGHKHLSTLDIYSNPSRDETIVAGLAQHERQRRQRERPPPLPPVPASAKDRRSPSATLPSSRAPIAPISSPVAETRRLRSTDAE